MDTLIEVVIITLSLYFGLYVGTYFVLLICAGVIAFFHILGSILTTLVQTVLALFVPSQSNQKEVDQ